MQAVSSPEVRPAAPGRPLQLAKLPQGQHILVAGMTGSGKTTLMEQVLNTRRWSICLDTKRELRFDGWPIVERPAHAIEAVFDKRYQRAILRPRSLDDVEDTFAAALRHGGVTVGVDEIYMITTQPGSSSVLTYPPSYVLALTRGRSKKATVVTGTQRPRFLPLFAMTESSHFFVFELGSADDSKYLARMAGIPGLEEGTLAELRDHFFLYYSRPERRLVRSRIEL